MKYILIVILWTGSSGGGDFDMQEFNTEAACNEAKALIGETFGTQQVKIPGGRQDLRAFCVPKGAAE